MFGAEDCLAVLSERLQFFRDIEVRAALRVAACFLTQHHQALRCCVALSWLVFREVTGGGNKRYQLCYTSGGVNQQMPGYAALHMVLTGPPVTAAEYMYHWFPRSSCCTTKAR